MNETLKELLNEDIDRFEEHLRAFGSGDINRRTYKSLSGAFGSYAQRSGGHMLRLRLPGGRLKKEHLAFLVRCIHSYHLNCLKITTAQTIQIHNLPREVVPEIMRLALDVDIVCYGCGGDYPRNVIASPLSGVDRKKSFDVLPYAEAASNHLLTSIRHIHLPRKLKIAFSNDSANITHATFRDLGFVANDNHTFSVYCAGGLGPNPKLGIRVLDSVSPSNILACIDAMISVFTTFGNYENRALSRSRYLQDTLGREGLITEFQSAFSECLKSSPKTTLTDTAHISNASTKSNGDIVHYHPPGGILPVKILDELNSLIQNISSAECRISPDGSFYVINLTNSEAASLKQITDWHPYSCLEQSVSCIGASLCQIGLRDSQKLLRNILSAVKTAHLPSDALPAIHVSGCLSSCGTHQISTIGFQGTIKREGNKIIPAFALFYKGSTSFGSEQIGEKLGIIPEDKIPEFIVELGTAVARSGLDFDSWLQNNENSFLKLASNYI